MEKPNLILMIEDEPQIAILLNQIFSTNGARVVLANTLYRAEYEIKHQTPDLIVLDWMLPDGSGIEWLKRLRQLPQHQHTPVLVLTARSQDDDVATAFEAGANDYLRKPFGIKELLIRTQTLLKRNQSPNPQEASSANTRLSQNGIELIVESRLLRLTNSQNIQPVGLSATESKLIALFMQHPKRIFDRTTLMNALHLNDVDERTIDAHIVRVRRKIKQLDAQAEFVQTVRGLGYIWKQY